MLAAEGTTDEKAVTEAYLQELSEDVLPIDALISFASSEKGAEVFGAEQAKSMAEAGKASKANGGKYCICRRAAQAEQSWIRKMKYFKLSCI